MKLIYAHYPALADEFIRYVASVQTRAEERVLVLCPSRRLSGWLQQRLADEKGASANVYFKDFRSLLEELDAESDEKRLPVLPGDYFHNFILKTILQRPGSQEYPAGRGFVTALRASLRDLSDSLAEPDVLREHIATSTDPLIRAQAGYLNWLTSVYDQYLRETDGVPGYRSYKHFFEDALTQIPSSAWLKGFKQIIFYGFYDLTGRQLELFNRVRLSYPVTVFAPYAKHPAYAFAKRFFETNLLGASSDRRGVEPDDDASALGPAANSLFSSSSAQSAPGVTAASAAGVSGELFFTAKEILKLTRENGLAFADIAVIARSLEPYKNDLPGVFAANGIALKCNLSFYLPSLPLGVFCLNLLGLLRGGFYREDVLAVVSSPYFKRANNWRYLIAQSLAERDYSQWTDLMKGDTPDSADFLTWLERCKTRLEKLSAPMRWGAAAELAAEFLQDNTNVDALQPADHALWKEILQTTVGFTRFEAVRLQTREGEFLDDLTDALKQIEQHRVQDAQNGVTVTDALNARGLCFKAVFVLGLNEKAFPQAQREDPVLKDFYRRPLRDGLGFWINGKMDRLEEEKLLFFAAVTSAREKLYLLFQRTGEDNKPLVPSSFLAELARACGLDLQGPDVRRVSGRLVERLWQTDERDLSEKEFSLKLAVQPKPQEAYAAAGLLTQQTAASLRAAQKTASRGALNEYDGQIASGAEVFARSDAAGFSPSALQDLGRCPMKYFLAKGVGLKEPDDVLSRFELAPNLRGDIYHRVLMDFYKELYERGLLKELFASGLTARLDAALARNYTAQSYKTFGIYPVIWEILLEDIQSKLQDFVQKDVENMGPFTPSVFETLFEQIYQPDENLKMRVKGYIDRIDVNAADRTLRVIDYKSGRKGSKDLRGDILKHLILQPFIYWTLAETDARFSGCHTESAALLSINKGYDKRELSADGFEFVKPRADAFLTLLAGFIKGGSFFVNPTQDCQYCPYGAVCRKDAFTSLMRARHSPEFKRLQEARQ